MNNEIKAFSLPSQSSPNTQATLTKKAQDDIVTTWPLSMRALTSRESGKPRVVLLSTGAFNPIHRMHVQMFDHVKASLEADGHSVIGAVLSPSHHQYLASKLLNSPHWVIPAEQRLAMCRLAGKHRQAKKFCLFLFVCCSFKLYIFCVTHSLFFFSADSRGAKLDCRR